MRDEASSPARLLITDDHALARKGLRAMLATQPDLEVIGEAENGRRACELCRELRPDLVLMDMRMPDMDGLAATRAIKREFPRTIVLMLTSYEDPNYLSKALKAGAAGYILKDATQQELTDAIRKALEGESPLNQELATRLLLRLISKGQEEPAPLAPEGPLEERPKPHLAETLSSREIEVLRLIARGQTNQEIASNLLVSASTVKKHVRQIVAKLEVSDRTQAVVRAIELGLLAQQEER